MKARHATLVTWRALQLSVTASWLHCGFELRGLSSARAAVGLCGASPLQALRCAQRRCRAAGGAGWTASRDPWSVLGLDGPAASKADIRSAFRSAAKDVHPDVDGGSEEQFRLLVWAYAEAMAPGKGGASPDTTDFDDGFVAAWQDKFRSELGTYHSFDEIERQTDDDGWGDREPLRNFFVWRHDAAIEGGVAPGDVVIYRLSHNVDGRFWGVGEVLAIQATYTKLGPNGVVHLQPLMKAAGAESGGSARLAEDSWEEVATVRALDRLEVLAEGVTRLEDGSFLLGARSYSRVFESGVVHVPEY